MQNTESYKTDSKTSQNTESKTHKTSTDYLNRYFMESKTDSVMLSERSETKHLNRTNTDSIKNTEFANANKDASPFASQKAQHDE